MTATLVTVAETPLFVRQAQKEDLSPAEKRSVRELTALLKGKRK